MANTYTLIASNTLGSNTTTVTFSNIPNTYTDLILRISAKSSDTASDTGSIGFRFNSNTTTLYSRTVLVGDGSNGASSFFQNNNSRLFSQYYSGSSSNVTSTFGSGELYIPNYTSTASKPISNFAVSEGNISTMSMTAAAGLYRNSSAITSIEMVFFNADFVSGSSFFLYGIKSS